MKRSLPLIVQEKKLKLMFPDSYVKRFKDRNLEWIGYIKPTYLSVKYKVRILYKRTSYINVYVLNPKPLMLYGDEKELPHVYSTKEQKICLFYPKAKEWDSSLLFTKTIIPWASEWLMYYELWLSTGKWIGKGIHPKVTN